MVKGLTMLEGTVVIDPFRRIINVSMHNVIWNIH